MGTWFGRKETRTTFYCSVYSRSASTEPEPWPRIADRFTNARMASSMQSNFGGWGRVYSGVALISLATLLFELSLTRIFSVVFYYHFAFLAISIALFGLGVGGVFSYVIAAKPGNVFRKLGALSAATSHTAVASISKIGRASCRERVTPSQ